MKLYYNRYMEMYGGDLNDSIEVMDFEEFKNHWLEEYNINRSQYREEYIGEPEPNDYDIALEYKKYINEVLSEKEEEINLTDFDSVEEIDDDNLPF